MSDLLVEVASCKTGLEAFDTLESLFLSNNLIKDKNKAIINSQSSSTGDNEGKEMSNQKNLVSKELVRELGLHFCESEVDRVGKTLAKHNITPAQLKAIVNIGEIGEPDGVSSPTLKILIEKGVTNDGNALTEYGAEIYREIHLIEPRYKVKPEQKPVQKSDDKEEKNLSLDELYELKDKILTSKRGNLSMEDPEIIEFNELVNKLDKDSARISKRDVSMYNQVQKPQLSKEEENKLAIDRILKVDRPEGEKNLVAKIAKYMQSKNRVSVDLSELQDLSDDLGFDNIYDFEKAITKASQSNAYFGLFGYTNAVNLKSISIGLGYD